MITSKCTKSWIFTIPRGEITYNLTIPAETQAEAASKLTNDLTAIIEELKPLQKVGTN